MTAAVASLHLTFRDASTLSFGESLRRSAAFSGGGRQSARQCRRRSNSVPFTIRASIGFTADPKSSVERVANGLVCDAASLLVYQEVLKAPPAQHFLTLLLQLRSSSDGAKILSTYGEFYRSLVRSGSTSWEEFLLDGILSAENNPFAQLAQGVSPSADTRHTTDFELRAAAVSDLECLQSLAVNESTLSGWVTNFVEVRPAWLTAVRAGLTESASTRVADPVPVSAPSRPPQMGFGFALEENRFVEEERGVKDPKPDFELLSEGGLLGLAAPSHRKAWREAIGGLWKWSDAVDALSESYKRNGTGPAAFYTDLVWRGGKLSLASPPPLKTSPYSSETLERVKEAVGHFLRDDKKYHPQLFLLPDETIDLRDATAEFRGQGVRTVIVGRGDVKNILSLLRAIRHQPSLKFCILMAELYLQAPEETYFVLWDALGSVVEPWPSNAMICATTASKGLAEELAKRELPFN